MRKIDKIIIHCSATYPQQDIGVKEITDWHTQRGFDTIGYHFVIRRNGELELGRPIERVGAHCTNHNSRSIGICLVGGLQDGKGGDANNDGIIEEFENGNKGAPECNYTSEQFETLISLLQDMSFDFPAASIHGHNEFASKACPCFDVQKWVRTLQL